MSSLLKRFLNRFISKSLFIENSNVFISRRHTGVLTVGASYTEYATFQVPHAIHGNYFFIVATDVYDNVYEHTHENDNSNFTMVIYSYPSLSRGSVISSQVAFFSLG